MHTSVYDQLMPGKHAPAEDRFWRFVEKSEGCWLWTGSKSKRGYGHFKVSTALSPTRSHQFSWKLHFGEIPEGLWVLHTCDIPACVNPDHLFLGTALDNVRDMISKGRQNWVGGGPSSRSKLTSDQVKAIRRLHATGDFLHRDLAEMFGIDRSNITRVINGRHYR